jgi:hypothetical protein
MPNHIHLLIETSVEPLSKIMQGIQQSYTSYFHNKHKSVGHLFQSRYKAILCEKDSYLLELIRYIHLNPLRASLVEDPEDYLWSSHRVYLEFLYQPFIKTSFILRHFSEDNSTALRLYNQFIQDGVDERKQDEFYNVVDQLYLGSLEFIDRAKRKSNDKELNELREIDQSRKDLNDSCFDKKKTLSELLKSIAKISKISQETILSNSRAQMASDIRSLFAYVATKHLGFRNKILAEFLKRESSSISNMVRKVDEKISNDQLFADHVNEVIKLMKA